MIRAAVIAFAALAQGGLCAVSYFAESWTGVGACLVASLVCWFAAIGGHLVGRVFRYSDPQSNSLAALAAIVPRMTIPLAVAAVVMLRGGRLAESGFGLYLIAAYLVTLWADTALALANVQSHRNEGS